MPGGQAEIEQVGRQQDRDVTVDRGADRPADQQVASFWRGGGHGTGYYCNTVLALFRNAL